MLRILLGALLFSTAACESVASAHDIWIGRDSYRNPAGEWCCGAMDCGVVTPGSVKASSSGYSVRGSVTYGKAVTGDELDGPTRNESVDELVPYSQAMPSADGSYWRCKRPDNSRRCFFAPSPGS